MNKLLVILGAGESGVGTALLARKEGWQVFVSDKCSIKEKYKQELEQANIEYEELQHTEKRILDADEVVKSPGIPDNVPLVKALKGKDIPVISEIEFAGRYLKGGTICITGSNGKTTTTLLTKHILRQAGVKVEMAGNVGISLARQVAEGCQPDWWVIELSSFQLDGMYQFKADVAVMMNITPDHLDRYEYDMQKYVDSKFRLIQNQTEKDYFIYCWDDEVIKNELKKRRVAAVKMPFSIDKKFEAGAYVDGGNVIINSKREVMSISLKDLSLKGRHNLYNSMAAGIAAHVLKLRKSFIRESLSSFKGVEHRLEKVVSVRGIEFINDSKATNINSTWYALECMSSPIIWIAGGVDKGNDYNELAGLAKEKVKALICLGKDNQKLLDAFGEMLPVVVEAQSMEEAVQKAYTLGEKGDVVLLSPACASFDLFDNYEQRGKLFKESVCNL
ncbi:UDP-N-acetylmuramoyl-L-alanine--D-glutamate ligase [Marinilabiliaceae bacterium JC017]|nr:UDP-N-acetylmuramoyl-L-alanine--D-glutamate ligase [Marinilabiliaceae bacterium JC017]